MCLPKDKAVDFCRELKVPHEIDLHITSKPVCYYCIAGNFRGFRGQSSQREN